MEEDDILGQYNLPQEAEKLYFQVDTLAAYNVQNKIDLYDQEPEFNELDYTRKRQFRQIKDALYDYTAPGLKNLVKEDNLFLFLSNSVAGAVLRGSGPMCVIGNTLFLPRPAIGSEGYATNLPEVLIASLSQCESVVLGGELIDLIKKDQDMLIEEKKFIDKMINDVDFIRTGKYKDSFDVTFGGRRDIGKVNWFVAAYYAFPDQLTWIIRHTKVHANAVRKGESVTITYHLDPKEILDLRPNRSSIGYDIWAGITGFFYHDIGRGNDQMRVKATWTTTIQLDED